MNFKQKLEIIKTEARKVIEAWFGISMLQLFESPMRESHVTNTICVLVASSRA